MSALYRLVYASKNLLREVEAGADLEQILAASRRNNAAAGITGALMFNGGAFAQVLEGPQRGVEETFERIQRDPRHGEVTVLECGPVAERGFSGWSMAFVGQSVRGRALWSGLASGTGFDLGRLDGDAVFAMLHGLVLEEEGVPMVPPAAAPPPARIPTDRIPTDRIPPALDAARVRAEVARLRPDCPAGADRAGAEAGRTDRGAAAALAILKAALADERGRTTALRAEVDDLRVALAACHASCDGLRAQRDLWTQRARVLATALCEDPGEILGTAGDADAPAASGRTSGTAGRPDRAVA